MKVTLIHIGYFIALIMLSVISFFIIFGAEFGGGVDLYALFIPLVFSVMWISDYTWRLLSLKPDKIQLIRPTKDWAFISLYLSGIFIVFSLFLSTLLPVLGISIILLLIWYFLLYGYTKKKNKYALRVLGSILFISSIIYAYLICEFYILST